MAYNLDLDLALVKIVGTEAPLPTIKFADSETVAVGDQVYAIGHPEQGGLWSLTTGIISANWQDYGGIAGKNLFQTDASINRGNSGGPLLDERGRMIGVNSMIARKAKDGLMITDINFSIRSNVVLNWLENVGYQFKPFAVAKKDVVSRSEKEAAEGQKKSEKTVEHKKKVVEQSKEKASEVMGQTEKPGNGNILTDRTPYNMEELIADIRDMEDLMQEMKDEITKFRERR